MSARASATDQNEKKPRRRAFGVFFLILPLGLGGCSREISVEPLVEYSTELVIGGNRTYDVRRHLQPGTYLFEVQERDVDLRIAIDAGNTYVRLADAHLRHGFHRAVVRLTDVSQVRIAFESVDMRSWKGAAAVRILRWPEVPGGAESDSALLGFEALGAGGQLIARGTVEDWRAALELLREAAVRFRASNDLQHLAEAEYHRAQLELSLLSRVADSRASAQAALGHFRLAGDAVGASRAELLLARASFRAASESGGTLSAEAQRILAAEGTRHLDSAVAFFETAGMTSDVFQGLALSRIRETLTGRVEDSAFAYETLRRRARRRDDELYEAIAAQNLGYLAQRRGNAVRAAALYEGVLPLLERDRHPELYAGIRSDLGQALIALGEFDRALALHTEALELYSVRGDDGQAAKVLTSLATIHFRTGNVERALATIDGALPLYERSGNREAHASALRLAGNASTEIGRHDRALDFLRRAERIDINGVNVDRTRVLIAGELRLQGELRNAEQLLAEVLHTRDASTRADALMERARLRQQQQRHAEALADLREADAIYARLVLDFNRIDSSAALAQALLASGDLAGAGNAADTAIALESRIRAKSGNPEMRARFLAASYSPYETRIEVDLASAQGAQAGAWRAFRTAEAIRARSLTDRLAQKSRAAGETRDSQQDFLRSAVMALQVDLERGTSRGEAPDDLLDIRRRIDKAQANLDVQRLRGGGVRASRISGLPESLATVQAALPEDTAVLAYFVGDQRSHGWMLTRTLFRHTVLPGRANLESRVDSFIERQREYGAARDTSLDPVLGQLLNGVAVRRLLILPDGPLNNLPFAALPIPGKDGRELLVDRFVLASAPSLALALRPSPPRDASARRVAVVFDPVYTAEDRRLTSLDENTSRYRSAAGDIGTLARLPYSAIEGRAVIRAFRGDDIIALAGFDATARRVIALPSQELDVLHFATHAVARHDLPEQSALFLSEFGRDGKPLAIDRLTTDDITRSGLRADIVVLSGCSTGAGRELRGEGVLGLTYGFLANGSHAVIASLWPVEDALTARLMEEFYRAYRISGRADDALHTAQLRTRAMAGTSIWSSFVLRTSSLP